jgi:hypothetical protein
MDVEITKTTYYAAEMEDRPGVLAEVTAAVAAAGINLQALMGLPSGPGRGTIAVIPEDAGKLRSLASQHGIALKEGTVFLIRGEDRPGALVEVSRKIAAAGINIQMVAALAVGGKFAAALTVAPADVDRTSQVLGVGG